MVINRHIAVLFWIWTRREIRSRFAGSFMGGLWAVLQPVLTVALFYVIFAVVLQIRIPELAHQAGYFYFLLTGLLPWLSISEAVSRAAGSLLAQEQFLQKLAFPKDIIPAAAIVASLPTQVIGSVVLIILLLIVGDTLSLNLLWWPVVFGLQMLLLLGIGFGLAALAFYIKDLIFALPIVLQIFFYTTPILYSLEMVPPAYRSLYLLNPFFPLIEMYHFAFLGLPMQPLTILAGVVWAMVAAVCGLGFYWLTRATLGEQP